jgi:fatty acid desaturase
MNEPNKINWYRCKVDKAVMSELMRRSDARAFAQVIPQLLLFAATGTLVYQLFLLVNVHTWPWALPLLLAGLLVHGTFSSFYGGIAGHELCHKTPFATQFWNSFFLDVYSFISWFDPIGYRASHIRHHQSTIYKDYDGEVVLPQGNDWWQGFGFFLKAFTFNPVGLLKNLRFWVVAACGRLDVDGFFNAKWLNTVLPESNPEQRRAVIRWARTVVLGHLALAVLFVATGHWFLVVIFTFGTQYCPWFLILCGGPQHVGLSSNVPDFRLNTRTYTCAWLPAFLYWNMQYHCEHHMFPAVPFYNLPRLRRAIEHDLPAAPHGLWATWKDELLPILRRQREDPSYVFIPKLPGSEGDRASEDQLLAEASQEK